MKFATNLLILLITSTTLSFNLNNIIIKEPKTSKEVNYEEESTTAIKQCEDGLEKYTDCLYGSNKFTTKNIEEVCNIFHSKKCRNLFKDQLNSVPICLTIPQEIQNNYKNLIAISQPSLNFFCQKNEKEKFCPMVKLELSNKNNISEKRLMNSVKETCNSKKCTEATLNLYTVLKDAIDHEEAILNEDSEAMKNNKIIMNVLQILQSDECKNKNNSKKNNKENFKKIIRNIKLYL
jgi:hypothetical protein